MASFHYDLVRRAVQTYAFPGYDIMSLESLPFYEPPFRHLEPNTLIQSSDKGDDGVVFVSKKPEGNREIFVGIYDSVDGHFYMYATARNKITYFVHPNNPEMPVFLSRDFSELRKEALRTKKISSPHIMFVLDVCRVFDPVLKNTVNVILSDVGPFKFANIPPMDFRFMSDVFNLRYKIVRPYTSPEDVDAVVRAAEPYPYHPDNGIVFVQVKSGEAPKPTSVCIKFTPPSLATVFLHVQPIRTVKTNVWKLSLWHNDNLHLYKTIHAPEGFYVPPTGAVVAFQIRLLEAPRWIFVPVRMRADKATPSAMVTLHRFIRRSLPREFQPPRNNSVRRPRILKRSGGEAAVAGGAADAEADAEAEADAGADDGMDADAGADDGMDAAATAGANVDVKLNAFA
jgi:hypothetical protein